MNSFPQCSVLQVEDNQPIADLVVKWLEKVKWVRYLGSANSIANGIEESRRQKPDILILDVVLPDGDSIDYLNEFSGLPSPPKVILHTGWSGDAFLQKSSRCPVQGVVWKAGKPDDLMLALSTVASGQRYFSNAYLESVQKFRSSPDAFDRFLSSKQIDIQRLAGRGLDRDEICRELEIEPATLKSQQKRIWKRLGLQGSSELNRWRKEHGFNVCAPW